ncbi:MAG: LamG domain-containing protein [Verrucomicrobiales bacterium]
MKKLLVLSLFLTIGSLSSHAALVGLWRFEGGTNDSSGNGNNGALQNGASLSGDVANATAGISSLALAGGTQHVLVPHHSSLDVTSAMTIAAWVKPANNQWDGIVAKSPSAGSTQNFPGNYELRTNNGGGALEFGFELNPGPPDLIFTPPATTALVANQWAHIAFSATAGGSYTYYVNGVSAGGGAMDAGFGSETNTNPLYIGSRADLFTTFDGNLDELAIFNTELSAAEIGAIMANGIPEPSTALLGLVGTLGLLVRRRR